MNDQMGCYDVKTLLAAAAVGTPTATAASGLPMISERGRQMIVQRLAQLQGRDEGSATTNRWKTPVEPASSHQRTPGGLLTVAETAERLRCSQKSIWRMLKAGSLRGSRIAGSKMVRVRTEDVERCLAPLDPVEEDLDQFIAGQMA